MSPQLDPFIIYTVKLAMDFKSSEDIEEPRTPIPTRHSNPFAGQVDEKEEDKYTNPMYPETMARIMAIQSFAPSGDKAPKLRTDNVLSLLYHADEQWYSSTSEVSKAIHDHVDDKQLQYAVQHVHRQQRIYLDTLHLLQKAVFPNESHRRFNEPIWFAIQVLNNRCQIRHLEYFTDVISPLATNVHEALEKIRFTSRRLLRKQEALIKQYQHQPSNFFASIFSLSTSVDQFYKSRENLDLLARLEPCLVAFADHWSVFENTLYECYVHAVFGKYHTDVMMEPNNLTQEILQQPQQLPNVLFHDQFTQLLPIILERAINLQIIDINAIQSLDPIAFVAVPRLAILAGVTWLAHLTGWRSTLTNLPLWIRPHVDNLGRITSALDQLEVQLLKNQSEDAHRNFVTRYQRLEQALVSGAEDHEEEDMLCQRLEKEIYRDICITADSVLASSRAQAFTVVLCHLFKHFGLQYDIEFEEAEDATPLEQTILDLAI